MKQNRFSVQFVKTLVTDFVFLIICIFEELRMHINFLDYVTKLALVSSDLEYISKSIFIHIFKWPFC